MSTKNVDYNELMLIRIRLLIGRSVNIIIKVFNKLACGLGSHCLKQQPKETLNGLYPTSVLDA